MYVLTELIKELNKEMFKNNNQKSPLKTIYDVKNINLQNLTSYAKLLIHDIVNDVAYTTFTSSLRLDYNNLNNKLKDYISLSKNAEIHELLNLKYNLVGGSVRDIILDKEPHDFDFCTDIPYCTIKNTLEKLGYSTKEAGEHFLVLIASKNGNQYEIANYRKDIYNKNSDGRHPSNVEIGTITEDTLRRDFTINSLFYSTKNGLQDPTGTGIRDILSKTLRFVGNPKDRIRQDYLRVFRFYRFINTLKPIGFKVHPQSLRDVRTMFNTAVQKTNPERIKNEIEKICL